MFLSNPLWKTKGSIFIKDKDDIHKVQIMQEWNQCYKTTMKQGSRVVTWDLIVVKLFVFISK